jgi:hypothetical protein
MPECSSWNSVAGRGNLPRKNSLHYPPPLTSSSGVLVRDQITTEPTDSLPGPRGSPTANFKLNLNLTWRPRRPLASAKLDDHSTPSID